MLPFVIVGGQNACAFENQAISALGRFGSVPDYLKPMVRGVLLKGTREMYSIKNVSCKAGILIKGVFTPMGICSLMSYLKEPRTWLKKNCCLKRSRLLAVLEDKSKFDDGNR